MKLLRLCAFAAVVSLAACSSSPTGSASADPISPSFDGGAGIGSDNYAGAENDPGSSSASSDTTSTTQRGGNGLGSGN